MQVQNKMTPVPFDRLIAIMNDLLRKPMNWQMQSQRVIQVH